VLSTWISRRALRWSLLAVLLWTILAVTWSGLVAWRSWWQAMDSELVRHTQRIAGRMQDTLGGSEHMPVEIYAWYRYVSDLTLSRQAADAIVQRPEIKYVVLWETGGMVIAHSQGPRAGTIMDPRSWSGLPTGQPYRLTAMSSNDITSSEVYDVTMALPLVAGGRHQGYISIGYDGQWLHEQLWSLRNPWLAQVALLTFTGNILLVLGIALSDYKITQARLLQEQTVRARTSLLSERGMLASVLAHEVRSPLTALRFNLHSMRSLAANAGEKAARLTTLADSCDREIRRLDQMLNDFLNRTQVITPVEHSPINQVIREAVDFLRPSLEGRDTRISLHLATSDPRVYTNPDELRQVILNLAANAQDAMGKGGTLAISTLAETDQITILVRDSGQGIPPELQQRIFEPFFSTKPNGSGLGLALVRRVISGAGGKVYCESEPGKGTTFRLVLPRAPDTPAGRSTVKEESPPTAD